MRLARDQLRFGLFIELYGWLYELTKKQNKHHWHRPQNWHHRGATQAAAYKVRVRTEEHALPICFVHDKCSFPSFHLSFFSCYWWFDRLLIIMIKRKSIPSAIMYKAIIQASKLQNSVLSITKCLLLTMNTVTTKKMLTMPALISRHFQCIKNSGNKMNLSVQKDYIFNPLKTIWFWVIRHLLQRQLLLQ